MAWHDLIARLGTLTINEMALPLGERRTIQATVSARALKVAKRISFRGFFHQPGIRPQRIGTSARGPSPLMTTSTSVVGQMLKRGCRFDADDTSEYIAWICAQV